MQWLTSLIILKFLYVTSQKFIYLDEVFENDQCDYGDETFGKCLKISNCSSEFDKFRKGEIVLKICTFGKSHKDSVICCPQLKLSKLVSRNDKLDIFDLETCRDKFLEYRHSYIDIERFVNAMNNGEIPITDENCELLKAVQIKEFGAATEYFCDDVPDNLTDLSETMNNEIMKKIFPSMAAIGLVQSDSTIKFICVGSIITAKFVITAAHCQYENGTNKQVDRIRVGGLSEEDDENAQQLKIEKFIVHPEYNESLHYNDIAVVKIAEKLIFSKFVLPSCIGDFDENSIVPDVWSAYGIDMAKGKSEPNDLVEIKTFILDSDECNKTSNKPKGILESQFCVTKLKNLSESLSSDAIYEDSGSLLVFKRNYETFDNEFNNTFLPTIYEISTVVGIESYTLEERTIYTKIEYFKDWIEMVIQINE